MALLSVILVWGVRDYEHRRAINALEARLYEGADPVRVSAYAMWGNPFRWHGVVETQNFFASMLVDSSVPDVDPEGHMRIRYKPEETPVTLAAKRSYLGRVYLYWADYPITETEQLPRGYIVRFRDLRYDDPERERRAPLTPSAMSPSLVGRRGRRRPASPDRSCTAARRHRHARP